MKLFFKILDNSCIFEGSNPCTALFFVLCYFQMNFRLYVLRLSVLKVLADALNNFCSFSWFCFMPLLTLKSLLSSALLLPPDPFSLFVVSAAPPCAILLKTVSFRLHKTWFSVSRHREKVERSDPTCERDQRNDWTAPGAAPVHAGRPHTRHSNSERVRRSEIVTRAVDLIQQTRRNGKYRLTPPRANDGGNIRVHGN